ncbi:MAG: hypothetical protein KC455_00950 [Carnobacterium sp.]|jgi:hypothetical protein|nr:hypothetical protein [Carnobacterium sp.]
MNKKNSDALIIITHLSYILLSFIIAIYTPFYVGALLIFTHWLHEKFVGDCILTVLQRKYGFANKEEDFFHYLFRKLTIPVDAKLTIKIHYLIKTIILIIVLIKFYFFIS